MNGGNNKHKKLHGGDFTDSNGVVFRDDKTTLILYPSTNISSEYIIPAVVTSIGDYAFQNNKLTTVNIPSFDILGNHSFSYNTITRVTIG